MSRYTFLKSTDLTFDGVWRWAKKLVEDLEKGFGGTTNVPVGSTMFWHSDEPPLGWLLEDGALYAISQYPALFNEIGYKYGGAENVFAVRDSRNRIFIGAGTLVALGAVAGASEVAVDVAHMPAHNHTVNDAGHTHVFTGAPHGHTVTDPQHDHSIVDLGHTHAGGAIPATSNKAAGGNPDFQVGDTASALADLDINPSATGVTVDDATAAGTLDLVESGVTLQPEGGGTPLNILNPVIGVHMIVKY